MKKRETSVTKIPEDVKEAQSYVSVDLSDDEEGSISSDNIVHLRVEPSDDATVGLEPLIDSDMTSAEVLEVQDEDMGQTSPHEHNDVPRKIGRAHV